MMHSLGVAGHLSADDAIGIRLTCATNATDARLVDKIHIKGADAGAIVRADGGGGHGGT